MENEITILNDTQIQNKIHTIRDVQVILDTDLAGLYQVETKNLNRAAKRNIERFPEKFRFQLTNKEFKNFELYFSTSNSNSLRFQNGTLETGRGKHRKYLPYAFTEQGVAMLSALLRSKTAVRVSIQIINAFVEMRKFILTNTNIFQRINNIETKQLSYQIKTDDKFEKVFKALEDKSIIPKQGLFYNGQVFDAYSLIADIIRTAKKSIILIDNYVDDTVLKLFTKRNKNVTTTIYCKTISQILRQDLEKYNKQYELIKIQKLKTSHDRFLIIDKKTIYHFGASLKDLCKKWFVFFKMDIKAMGTISNLKNGVDK